MIGELPRTLEYLNLACITDHPGIRAVEVALYLPLALTELCTPDVSSLASDPSAPWPSKLKKWLWNQVRHPLKHAPPLPERLERLEVELAQHGDLFVMGRNKVSKYLPRCVKELYLHFHTLKTYNNFDKLPPRFTALHTAFERGSKYSSNPAVLRSLPSMLTSLYMHLPGLKPLKADQDWLPLWPPRLQRLDLDANGMCPLGACFWASFSSLPLQDLHLCLYDFTNIPESLEFFKKTPQSRRSGPGLATSFPHILFLSSTTETLCLISLYGSRNESKTIWPKIVPTWPPVPPTLASAGPMVLLVARSIETLLSIAPKLWSVSEHVVSAEQGCRLCVVLHSADAVNV